MTSRVMIFSDERMRLHSGGAGHPERPARLEAIDAELQRAPIANVEVAKPEPAPREAVLRVHDERYVSFLESLRGKTARLDADTAVSPDSVDVAYLAAGAAIDAVDAVMRKQTNAAFALVRPPGHHAERDRAMGFCLFNNIAIAAVHAIDEYGLERVMIVDWDVHHGNGTQHAFEDRRDVLFISSHQWPLWPGSGAMTEHGRGAGEGFTVNIPLPPGFDDAGYISLFQRVIVPVAEQYRPQLVLVSAGFDAHVDDPLAGMRMTEQGYAALCAIVKNVALRHSDGCIALILEGGYDLNALARSVHACASTLATEQAAPAVQEADHRAKAVIDHLIDAQRRFWRL